MTASAAQEWTCKRQQGEASRVSGLLHNIYGVTEGCVYQASINRLLLYVVINDRLFIYDTYTA